jgi:enoyl-CoA hydratase/carnithine racemase
MSEEGSVDLERREDVAFVTLNRPSTLNAITMPMYRRLGAICTRFSDDPSLRVVVVRGAGGKALSSGTDIGVLASFESAEDGIAYESDMDRYLGLLASVPVPTLAAIEGLAVGGGLNVAVACDIRIATDDARFGAPVGRTLGSCMSMRNVAALCAVFGVPRVKRMLMLGQTLGTEEVLQTGFLARTAPRETFDAVLGETIEMLRANAPITQRVTKAEIARLSPVSFPNGDDLIAACYGSDDFRNAVEAFFDKRKPVWQGK